MTSEEIMEAAKSLCASKKGAPVKDWAEGEAITLVDLMIMLNRMCIDQLTEMGAGYEGFIKHQREMLDSLSGCYARLLPGVTCESLDDLNDEVAENLHETKKKNDGIKTRLGFIEASNRDLEKVICCVKKRDTKGYNMWIKAAIEASSYALEVIDK